MGALIVSIPGAVFRTAPGFLFLDHGLPRSTDRTGLGGRSRFRRVPAPLPWSCWKTAFLDLYGWSSGGGVADERKATTQAWRWGRDRAVLVKLTIRMARRVDKLHEGFVRAKARTKPTNCDND